MAYNDPTTNYGWDLPFDLGDTDAWGQLLNDAIAAIVGSIIESIDTVLGLLQDESDTLTSDITALDARVRALTNTPVYARVYRTAAAQTIPDATETDLEWDTEVFDQGDLFDAGSPEVLTFPQKGLYQVRATVRAEVSAGSDDGRQWILRIYHNAAVAAVTHFPGLNDNVHDTLSGEKTLVLSTLVNAAAGDTVKVSVEQADVHGFGTSDSFVVSGRESTSFEATRFRTAIVDTFIALPTDIDEPILVSNDGSAWSEGATIDSGSTTQTAGIAFGDGVFVAASLDTIYSSSDGGATWTEQQTLSDQSQERIIYADSIGKFFLLGSTNVWVSSDGENWTAHAHGVTSPVGIAWSPSLARLAIVKAQTDTSAVSTSDDEGETWTVQTTANIAGTNTDIAWSADRSEFLVLATSTQVARSSDGISWTDVQTNVTDLGDHLTRVDSLGLYFAANHSGTANDVGRSTDGDDPWSAAEPGSGVWGKIIFGANLLVMPNRSSGTDGERIATSSDGITWTRQTTPAGRFYRTVAFGQV